MAFVKDKTYRDLPFSPETPSDGKSRFFTVRELVETTSRTGPGRVFRCRTIGIVKFRFGEYFLHEIGDESVRVILSLVHFARPLPHGGFPYPAQLFGFVQNRCQVGVVMFPHIIQSIPACMAVRILQTMQRITDLHNAVRYRTEMP